VSKSDGSTAVETLLEDVFSIAFILPIKGINIASDDLVTKTSNDRKNFRVIREVWWTHISWEFANDVQESSFKLRHFTGDTIRAEGG